MQSARPHGLGPLSKVLRQDVLERKIWLRTNARNFSQDGAMGATCERARNRASFRLGGAHDALWKSKGDELSRSEGSRALFDEVCGLSRGWISLLCWLFSGQGPSNLEEGPLDGHKEMERKGCGLSFKGDSAKILPDMFVYCREILEDSPSEKLLDAINQEGCDASCLSDAINIVNPNADFCLLVENAKQFMLEEWEKFESCLQKEIILCDGKEFIHLTDFSTYPVTKGKITRRFRKLKESYLHCFSSNVCKKHQKGDCNLVPKHIAFLFYLGLLLDNQQEDPQNIFKPEPEPHPPPFPLQSVSTIENLNKAEELEEELIDLALEEKESANLNVALFRAQRIVDEPTEDVPITETSLTLVHLPYFHLNGKDYITLHSIQRLFNIREDYCLAIISEASQVAKDFVDIEGESKEEFPLDLETSSQRFLEAPNAFEFCLKRVAEEEPVLKDEDFEATLVELGIGKFGRNIEEPNKIDSDLGKKIALERRLSYWMKIIFWEELEVQGPHPNTLGILLSITCQSWTKMYFVLFIANF
ncbi:hypothetical protein L7F22_020796 [Adiantum nelumboides]|nr:hypothetical protein [Adiantum nelumboides]